MGWASGTNAQGRAIGYAVKARCDEPGCTVKIDRGVDYVCGGLGRGIDPDPGCGMYFCSAHRKTSKLKGRFVDLCSACYVESEDEDHEKDDK